LEPGLVTIGVIVACSIVLLWQQWPWIAAVVAVPAAAGLALLRWHYGRRHRGTLTLGPEGVGVTTRVGVFDVPWQQIHRVYRFKEQLVFETVAPHRRHTLTLTGHERHQSALLQQLALWGHTLDLRWVERLGRALDD
jgi:hypothetical protein